jgi:hypothetical protein
MKPWQHLESKIEERRKATMRDIFSDVESIKDLAAREQAIGFLKGLDFLLNFVDNEVKQLTEQ